MLLQAQSLRFNRNIMGCKYVTVLSFDGYIVDLIGT